MPLCRDQRAGATRSYADADGDRKGRERTDRSLPSFPAAIRSRIVTELAGPAPDAVERLVERAQLNFLCSVCFPSILAGHLCS